MAETTASPTKKLSFEQLAAARKSTQAVSDILEKQLLGYLDTLRSLLVPERLLGKLADALAALPEWNHDACDAATRAVAAAEGVKAGMLINATRVAIVGRAVAPPLFDTMVALGRERVIARLRKALPLISAA